MSYKIFYVLMGLVALTTTILIVLAVTDFFEW